MQQLKEIAVKGADESLIADCDDIQVVVETACLLHDIGNPPFGHLGEKAIQDWFSDNAAECHKISTGNGIEECNPYYLDFKKFDGNPQGLRIVLTLQGFPGEKGLNLTYSQIASLVKYPRYSTDSNCRYKKIGVFTSEKNDVEKIWKELDIGWGARHPFVYLMEAADDIAYSLSDIEDGIEKGIISEEEVLSHLKRAFEGLPQEIIDNLPSDLGNLESSNVTGDFVGFRIKMINSLTNIAAQFFYDDKKKLEEPGNSGIEEVFDSNLEKNFYAKALYEINKFCKNKVYQSKEAEDIEIAGYNIVYGLLEKFSRLLKVDRNEFDKLVNRESGNNLERRMFSKIPESLVNHYKFAVSNNSDEEWYIRSQLIVDYVAGMTDDYALKMYKLINGIEIQVL